MVAVVTASRASERDPLARLAAPCVSLFLRHPEAMQFLGDPEAVTTPAFLDLYLLAVQPA